MSNEQHVENLREDAKTINKVSPSFCIAKWLQTTVHLHQGSNHSCHHPQVHPIPMDELKEDPSALTNTKFKMAQRELMLKGERPPECDYCWRIEDLGKDHISDRVYKSSSMLGHIERVKAVGSGKINPTYLEVSFENTCNFKCIYCQPEVSSKWMEEVKKFGPIPQTGFKLHDLDFLEEKGIMPYNKDEPNPYVDAFWDWWPSLYPTLETFRVTGGEPLLSKHWWRIVDWVSKNPRENLELAVNTNLGAPDPLIDRLIQTLVDVKPKVRVFDIYTSFESVGAQAEYARYGMKYDKFIKNLRRVLSETESRVNIMITFNLLSVPTFENFLETLIDLRREFNKSKSENRIPIMVAYLRHPKAFDMRILPSELKREYGERYMAFAEKNKFAEDTSHGGGLLLEEVDQIERAVNYMNTESPEQDLQRRDFALFIDEADRRRGHNFCETFPELVGFYNQCKNLV